MLPSSEMLAPFIWSNLLALILLAIAFPWPQIVRWFTALLFAGAAIFNAVMAITAPAIYVEGFGSLAVGFYADFIHGFFSAHVTPIVLSIAAGQMAIAVLLSCRRTISLGVFGAAIFLIAISPLGVGSAFPFPFVLLAALLVMLRRLDHDESPTRTLRAGS